jgi:UDP-N-acetylglucosamine--N-acetylmuramyl-(pentapeptide) pyrophosphoryl-undecaprenol N-acetylglucosamine transferase
MKILLTGGGTGGHFYPVIAVAQSLRKIIHEEKLIDATIYYMAPSPYDEKLLFENSIIYKYCAAGKMRNYFSILNIIDTFKTAFGILKATLDIFTIFPDVVFSKGGYVSFPVLFAARIFGIPVVIHESDSKPGRVSLWSSAFAKRIAISYPQAAAYFPKDKVAMTGNPIRKELMTTRAEGSREYWNLDEMTPLILILGGSQGSKKINEVLVDTLPKLVENYYVIHQTGKDNINDVTHMGNVVLNESLHRDRYKPRAYLNDLDMRSAAGAASLIISRAGSMSTRKTSRRSFRNT